MTVDINDTIEALVDAGFGQWSGYGMQSGVPFKNARLLRATLPDGKVADRHTTKNYAYVVAVPTDDGWKPFRWVIRESDLAKTIIRASESFAETQTLNVKKT